MRVFRQTRADFNGRARCEDTVQNSDSGRRGGGWDLRENYTNCGMLIADLGGERCGLEVDG